MPEPAPVTSATLLFNFTLVSFLSVIEIFFTRS